VARYAQKRQITIEYDLAPEITTVVSDQGKLRQVLYSFLAWSIGRTPIGGRTNLYADLVERHQLRLVIEDEGEQVANLNRVFDHETKDDAEPDVNDLGIIIGRRLLEIMNGSIDLQNRDSVGLRTVIQISARPSNGQT
jgi:K+-sensing histidine kinase KdpD